MADNIMDAFLLFVDENPEVREELDARIMNYPGDTRDITREVLVPFACSLGYNMTEEDVEYYNGHENDGSEVPEHLRKSKARE